MKEEMMEICLNCGLTYGSHRADSHCKDQCPKHEGRMDWPTMEEKVTIFKPTGVFRPDKIPHGTPSKLYQEES